MGTIFTPTGRANSFFYVICFMVVVSPSFCRFVIETMTSNETNFAVATCSRRISYKIGIFEKRLNWFEAQTFCEQAGYLALDNSNARRYYKIGIRVFLERTLASFTSGTFWQNQFRSDSNQCSSWYNYRLGHCGELSRDKLFEAELPLPDQFCSTAVINSSTAIAYKERIKLLPENCMTEHPFICNAPNGPQVYRAYYGFSVDSSPMLTIDSAEVGFQNFSECVRMCNNRTTCLAVVYNHSNGFCDIHIPHPVHLQVDLNVTYIGWNITFAHKAGCELSYLSLEETPPINVTENYTFPLPICNEPTLTLPDGYCPCDTQNYTVEQLDQLVSELVQNLTVPRGTTSSYKRTKTSADDTRTVARAVGTIGAIVTVAILSMPVISDVWAWKIRLIQRMGRVRIRRERKISRQRDVTSSAI